MAKHKMYENSPKMEHGEDGKVSVKKSHADKEKKMDGDKKPDSEIAGTETKDIHSQDIKDMHKRHSNELKDMHVRHAKEQSTMHTKHQKTAGATGGSTVDEPIEKVEKSAKA